MKIQEFLLKNGNKQWCFEFLSLILKGIARIIAHFT